jgi:3-oxoadipate enol-lactonase
MSKPTVDGNEIYYESYGSGEPIVFVGGLGSFCQGWKYQTEYFSKKYHVVLVDLPGLGKSSKLDRQPSLSLYANSIVSLIDKLGLQHVNFVGVSLGGAVGFDLAIHYPGVLKRLTVINMDTIVTLWLYWKYQAGLHVLGAKRFARVLSQIYLTGSNKEAIADWIESYPKNGKSALSAAMKTLKGWNIQPELGNIQCPVLAIASDDGIPITAKKEHLETIHQLNFEVIGGAKHFVHLDKPSETNQLIEDFIAA